jgi:peptide/nickel transport system ATP-binding protein
MSKSDSSDFDQSISDRTRVNPSSVAGGEREKKPLLVVEKLVKEYPRQGAKASLSKWFGPKPAPEPDTFKAVDGISFQIARGESVGLVGESGCGKSTTGRSILRLIQPTSGSVRFAGQEVLTAGKSELAALRRSMQMIFQDPYASLNPRIPVGKAIAEPIVVHGLASRSEAADRAIELLRKVGLSSDMAMRLPHEFSGGQRQRLCIARALSLGPKLIVADEAVSALDVSIKAQVLNLLLDLQAEFGLSYLFISHDMATVERVSHRIAVMYLGEIVEIGPRAAIIENPQHPYTRKLLGAVPVPDPSLRSRRASLPVEDLPNPVRAWDFSPQPKAWRVVAKSHLVQEAF